MKNTINGMKNVLSRRICSQRKKFLKLKKFKGESIFQMKGNEESSQNYRHYQGG